MTDLFSLVKKKGGYLHEQLFIACLL